MIREWEVETQLGRLGLPPGLLQKVLDESRVGCRLAWSPPPSGRAAPAWALCCEVGG